MKSVRDSGRGLCWFQAKGTHACVEWVGMYWVGTQGTLPGTGGGAWRAAAAGTGEQEEITWANATPWLQHEPGSLNTITVY